MSEVKAFDSIMDMHAYAQQQREAADALIKGWQKAIRAGSKIIRVAEVGRGLLLIYGSIVDPIESERAHYDLSDPLQEAEFDHIATRYGPAWQESFRYGRFYSPMCVEGEFGSVHLATIMAEITDAEFETARLGEWPQDLNFARGAAARRSLS